MDAENSSIIQNVTVNFPNATVNKLRRCLAKSTTYPVQTARDKTNRNFTITDFQISTFPTSCIQTIMNVITQPKHIHTSSTKWQVEYQLWEVLTQELQKEQMEN